MNKIEWTEEELKSMDSDSYIICTYCGWLINELPKTEDKCCNCGKTYEQTKSQIKRR